jgi:hypothetical protein
MLYIIIYTAIFYSMDKNFIALMNSKNRYFKYIYHYHKIHEPSVHHIHTFMYTLVHNYNNNTQYT